MVLGEHFCAHWVVTPTQFPNPNPNSPSTMCKSHCSFISETASMWSTISLSSNSAKSRWSSFSSKTLKSPSTAATSVEAELDEAQAQKKLVMGTGKGPTGAAGTDTGKVARLVYITEQVSHLPISAHFTTCPQRSLPALQHQPDISHSLWDEVACFSWAV